MYLLRVGEGLVLLLRELVDTAGFNELFQVSVRMEVNAVQADIG